MGVFTGANFPAKFLMIHGPFLDLKDTKVITLMAVKIYYKKLIDLI